MNMSLNTAFSKLEDQYGIPTYAKWPVAFVRGQGCELYDADGNCYLDLYGGHCTSSLGHCHPRWVEALATQAARLGFYSNVAANDVRARYLEKLVAFAPGHLTHAFLCNSGAEANETALKLALKATGRARVIAMQGGFHGRTVGALSLTQLGHYRAMFPQLVFEVTVAPFGDVEALGALLDDDTAAVILEPLQSLNGVNVAPAEYYRELVQVCHANDTLVIFDEVQTGMGRLGASFAAELFAAPADLITTAKALGNGFPMATVLTSDAIAGTVAIGDQGTTFGGGPLACAAGMAVLEVIEEAGLVAHAAQMGQYAREQLVRGPVREVKGHGLLLGLVTEPPAREVCRYLFDQGLLVGTSSNAHVARLMPPLIVGETELQRLARALDEYPA